jgi:hypothetical protein
VGLFLKFYSGLFFLIAISFQGRIPNIKFFLNRTAIYFIFRRYQKSKAAQGGLYWLGFYKLWGCAKVSGDGNSL